MSTVYLKGNKDPKNCGCAVLSEFSLEELAIVEKVQCEKLGPPHPKVLSNASLFTVYFKGNKGSKNCGCAVLSENAKTVAKWPGKTDQLGEM